MSTGQRLAALFAFAFVFLSASAAEKLARNPYLGAIVTDAWTGEVLFEDNADARGYPASITKLMTFGIVMDRVGAGQLRLDTPVTVSAAAARTGGSQVYLKQGEVFTVDDLLYALIVQSANDAAVALAEHVAGSKEAFVSLMNSQARELGLTNTTFHSPHGLPPGRGQLPDVSTARDLARLSRELIKRGAILRYSSTKQRPFREASAQPFIMRTHNHLLGVVPGCDGLKTGYYSAAGFSLAASVERDGRRIITVVLGSAERVPRDVKTKELIEHGFASAKLTRAASPTATAEIPAPAVAGQIPVIKPSSPVSSAPTVPQQCSTAESPTLIFRVIPPNKP
ncbi:MAG: D-alanyl-D-alanine carboxypeptidase [Opitutaceae bacterium]|nr:D-alanyl-D-alanine carboxypeptidase [Opitutaceae bacterium]